MGNPASQFDPGAGGKQTPGMLYNQFLASVLQAMGMPPTEFERWGPKGYGSRHQGELDAAVRQALQRHVVALLPDGQRRPAVPQGLG